MSRRSRRSNRGRSSCEGHRNNEFYEWEGGQNTRVRSGFRSPNSGAISRYQLYDDSEEDELQYHCIPVYPNESDLMTETPLLRSNIVEGCYSNVEDYLDIQFRLLKEDSVRTFREDIIEYINFKENRNKKGLRVYKDVRFVYPESTFTGVCHCVSFKMDGSRKKDIKWDKRLMEGSLVCLSKDKFKTMHLATVFKRDVEMLKAGRLFLCLEVDDFVQLPGQFEEFVMIENSAFFEAYRHVLTALQNMSETHFPFKRYIVDVSKNLLHPTYITNSTRYDLRPLLFPLPEVRVGQENGQEQSEIVYPHYANHLKNVDVLNPNSWLSASASKMMDQSQMNAIRLALTKEMAIIQGPPGTGKTYVGLRIIQVLLQNVNVWRQGNECTILIVCFTNHALDQFLEGVLKFTKNVVRVGGGSTSPHLKNYSLSEHRALYNENKMFPHYLVKKRKQANICLKDFKRDSNIVNRKISSACQEVMTEDTLEPHMLKAHSISLAAGNEFNDKQLILDWLGLRFRGKHALVSSYLKYYSIC